MPADTKMEAEMARVEKAIHDCLEWPFPEKNIDRLLGCLTQDSTLFIFHPDAASTFDGFESYKSFIDQVFLSDDLQPTSTVIRDLKIHLSQSGDVAWFSCIVDDHGEWQGRPYAWENTRWTGVLEKRADRWLFVQMHFSFASDTEEQSAEEDTRDSVG